MGPTGDRSLPAARPVIVRKNGTNSVLIPLTITRQGDRYGGEWGRPVIGRCQPPDR
jgi:hypothetical protein